MPGTPREQAGAGPGPWVHDAASPQARGSAPGGPGERLLIVSQLCGPDLHRVLIG